MTTSHGDLPYDRAKRVLDVAAASVLLVLTLPVSAVVAIAVAARLGRPVLFRQDRPGKHGRIFRLYKFRTMMHVDAQNKLTSDAERLTRFGRMLRSTSLDELPTLVNVIKGDMSVVGPRPLLVSYLDRYTVEQASRHDVRPGITGLAQASGRNSIGWDEKFALDVFYVKTRGFRIDAQILWRTVITVIRRDGISSADHATSAEFTGTSDRAER